MMRHSHYQADPTVRNNLQEAHKRAEGILAAAKRASRLGLCVRPLMDQFHEAQRRIHAAAQADIQNMSRAFRASGDFHSVVAVGSCR